MTVHTGQPLASLAEKNWYYSFDQLFRPEQVDRIHRICMAKDEQEALTGDNKDRRPPITISEKTKSPGTMMPSFMACCGHI